MEEKPRLKAYLSLFRDSAGRQYIQIRKVITDLEFARFLLSKILRKGKVVVEMELTARDPVRALRILKAIERTLQLTK